MLLLRLLLTLFQAVAERGEEIALLVELESWVGPFVVVVGRWFKVERARRMLVVSIFCYRI